MKLFRRISPGVVVSVLFAALVFGYFLLNSQSPTAADRSTSTAFFQAERLEFAEGFIPGGMRLVSEADQAPPATEAVLRADSPAPDSPLVLDEIHVRGRALALSESLDLRPPPIGRESEAAREFVFDLFDNVQLIGQVERLERHHDDRAVYYGPLSNVAGGDFILAYNQGHIAATFSTPGMGTFQLRPRGDGSVAALELDLSRLPPCNAGYPEDTAAATPADLMKLRAMAAMHRLYAESSPPVEGGTYNGTGQQGGSAAGLSFTLIDVLVVFTQNARNAVGGTDALQAIIDVTFARANSAFINSEVGVRLRMVRSEEVVYAETGSDTMLSNLADGVGAFADAPSWRNASGADLVALIFNGGGGRAYIYNGNENSGFSVNGLTAIESTFIHEIGHNLGCLHDRDNDNSITTVYPYSYGWRFTPEGSGQLRTIMAYAPGSSVPYFSNPDVTYMGTPTGVPIGDTNESHNAEVIRLTKNAVAAFRSESGNIPPSVVLESPSYSDPLKALDSVHLMASASDVDGTVSEVRFYRLMSDADFNFSNTFSTALGVDATAPYTTTESSAPAGFWTYAAVARDNNGALGVDTVSVTVAPHYRRTSLPLPAGKTRASIEGINEAGRFVGFGHDGNASATDTQAAYWENGGITLLDPLVGDIGAKAFAVDQQGTIYGESVSGAGVRRAVRWDDGVPTDISTLIGGFAAESAVGVDEQGQIYLFQSDPNDYRRFNNPGYTTTGTNQRWNKVANTGVFAAGIDFNFGPGAWRAMRWNNGGTQLAPLGGFESSWGRATNRSGAVFGFSSPNKTGWESGTTRLTFWPAGSTTPVDLGTLGATGGNAFDLNDWNEAVGQANHPEKGGLAVIWKGEGSLIVLDDLVLPQSGLKRQANAINNRGQIAGTGFSGLNQFIFLLDPLPGLDHRYWLANHYNPAELEDDLLTADDAAPAGDGLPNLLKRAFGLDPRVAAAGSDLEKLPQGHLGEDGHFHFRFRRLRAPRDMDYQPEGSFTLASEGWDGALFEQVDVTFLDADYEEVRLRTTFPVDEEDKAFGRIRLSR